VASQSYRLLAALICAAASTGASAASADDWPTFHHDNRRSGVTAEVLRPPLELHWVFESPAAPAKGWSLPTPWYGFVKNKPNVSYDDAFRVVAVGDTAYFCSSGENCAYAIDARQGRVKWRFFTDAAPRHAPVVRQEKVYFGADDGNVYCLRAADGKLLWQFRAAATPEQMLGYGRFSSLWPVRGGVMIDGGVLYFTAGLFPSEGIRLFALDAETGTEIYSRAMDHGHSAGPAPQGYLLANDDDLFFTARAANLRYDKATGRQKKTSFPLPTIDKSHHFKGVLAGSNAKLIGNRFVVGNGCLGFYEPGRTMSNPGKREYSAALQFDLPHVYEVIVRGDTAYLAALTHLAAYPADQLADVAAGEYREFYKAFAECQVAGKILTEEKHAKIVAEGGRDDPRAVHLKNTTFKWSGPHWQKWDTLGPEVTVKLRRRSKWFLPLVAHETMILAGDVLFAGGEDRVHAVDGTTGKALWSDETQSRVRGLTVANGRLFVSTIDGNVRCYAADATPGQPKSVISSGDPKRLVNTETDALAAQVLGASRWRRGYALVVGADDAGLAAALAGRTQLKITVLAADAGRVQPMRRSLAQAGLYGSPVTVEAATPSRLPFPPYVFNLVVDQHALRSTASAIPQRPPRNSPPPTPDSPPPTPNSPLSPSELLRVIRPLGGVLLTGAEVDADALAKDGITITEVGQFTKLTRGRIPGSMNWTHNYATPANTYCSEDPLVKAPLGVLWYGEPGPQDRIERHASPPIPLVVDGVVLTLGYDRVMAYDVYNGVELWRRNILGVTASGMGIDTSNVAADGDSLFVLVDNRRCLELDIKTGRTRRTILPPERENDESSEETYNFWSYLAVDRSTIYGSRAEVDRQRRRPMRQTSDGLFALDRKTGRLRWSYEGQGIDHVGICLADGRVFLIDGKLTDAEKRQALAETIVDRAVENRAMVDRKGNPLAPRLGKLVALDAQTGTPLWQRPLNVTDMTVDDRALADGPERLSATIGCMVKDGHLVVHGSGSFGHPWREFVDGQYARRALYVFDARSGKLAWGRRAGYRKRPIVVGEWIYAEPSAWHLKTGRQKTIANPLSGRPQKLDMHRGYIGCGHLLASGSAVFGNANRGIGVWNVEQRCGYTPLGDMWLGCGLGLTPANGVLAALEGRAGCNCGTAIHTSAVFYPRNEPRVFGGGAAGGMYPDDARNLPVKHLSVNLGAPGFHEDARRNLWLAYHGMPGRIFANGMVPGWYPAYRHVGSMFYDEGVDRLRVGGTDVPWVYCCGYHDTKRLAFTLRGKADGVARYTVRLHFAEPEQIEPGRRVFDVRLQDETVLSGFDVVDQAGGSRKALVKEFRSVEVRDTLTVEMTPTAESKISQPILCGVQAFAE